MNNSIIQAQNVSVSYHNTPAVRNISLDIPRNQITALIGASGSGKSTFLRALNRMIDVIPHASVDGTIMYDGSNILGRGTDVTQLRTKIGMVFQNPVAFPKSTYENIAYGLKLGGMRKPSTSGLFSMFSPQRISWQKLEQSRHKLDTAVVQSLKDAALWDEVKDRLHKSANGLSGGQKQRLCIARTIAIRPDVLLLDEPCSALDPISTRKIEELLLQLKEHYTIIIVTHNMQQARRIADFTGFFHMGDLVEFDTTENIFGQPRELLTKDYVQGAFG